MSTNLLNYANYDFDQLVIQLQERIKNEDAWKDIYRSGAGQTLIELLSYAVNLCLYYAERRAEESYINTAQLRSSVVNLVSLLNYQPKRKTSAIGNLKFSIAEASTKIIYVPRYTECESVDGLKYLTNESAAIQKGQTSVTVSGIQGELAQTEITSDGSTDQEYTIRDTSVENSADSSNPTLRVIVDGVKWAAVSSFLNSGSTSEHYRIINEMDETISILFGDNIRGKVPSSGSVILIQYIKSDGEDGNVTYTDKITTLNSTIYDESGSVVTVAVTNTSSFLGGDEAEDIEEIRYEAPRVFKTGNRAVNREDFMTILEGYPGVANANVWGENEEAEASGETAVQSMLNKVKISIVLQQWKLSDDAFKDTLSDYLYNLSMLTVKYEFVDPVFLYVVPRLIIGVNTGYSLSQTQADIEATLEDQFLLGGTTKLGTKVKYSNVLSAINDLDGVSYANMILEIYKELSSTYNSSYNWGAALEATNIKPESVRLFIGGSYVVSDVDNGDGTGTFSSAGVYIISGTVNYSTGELLINISPAASSVYVKYQQEDDIEEAGNINPSFNEICKLYTTDIESISIV